MSLRLGRDLDAPRSIVRTNAKRTGIAEWKHLRRGLEWTQAIAGEYLRDGIERGCR
jgi:hypothetical protein